MIRICLAQLNPTIGDLKHNVDALLHALDIARSQECQLVVTPELSLTGYMPRDLLEHKDFIRHCQMALSELKSHVNDVGLIVGAPVAASGNPLAPTSAIANAALLLHQGQIKGCHRKVLLPTYDVFDEHRYFKPGTEATVVDFAGMRIGLSVCEDIWNDKTYWASPRYERDPIAEQVGHGADLLINISASPYEADKPGVRQTMLRTLAKRYNRPILYVNQVGGNDALIFDGRSLVINPEGEIAAAAPAFHAASMPIAYDNRHVWPLSHADATRVATEAPLNTPTTASLRHDAAWAQDVTLALCLGLADYVRKCGFSGVTLGLSGGIDSALVAALAVRALGPSRVIGITMPSRYSSEGSVNDSLDLASRLGIRCDTLPIESIFQTYLDTLAPPFTGLQPDLTEENLQARIRGALLMAYSNKFGLLLLTTGNKSELATGYCTLYGDMCGGLGILSDIYKTQVYALARYLNATSDRPVIPESTLTKPPSAELRFNQTDQDSLPSYDELDAILERYIDHQEGSDALIAAGFNPATVQRVLSLTRRSEHKRRQAAPGLRVTRKAFGEGRRIPIAQGYDPMLLRAQPLP